MTATPETILSSVRLEYDRNPAFRDHAAAIFSRLRAVGSTLPPSDREALTAQLEDGRFLGKAALDDFLAKCTTPQWMMAKNAEEARQGRRRGGG